MLPHNCAWTVEVDNTNIFTRTATCPVGTHPITGGCASASLSISILSSQPTKTGGIIVSDGDAVTDNDSD